MFTNWTEQFMLRGSRQNGLTLLELFWSSFYGSPHFLIPGSLTPKATLLANSAPLVHPGIRKARSTMFGETTLSVKDEGLQLIRTLCFSET